MSTVDEVVRGRRERERDNLTLCFTFDVFPAAFCAASGLAALLLASMTCFMICCNAQREIGETEFEKRLQYGPSSTAAINERSGVQEL